MENDDEKEYEDESDEPLKITRYSFNSFRIERSIRDILSWENRGKIVIPDFQRNFVWDYAQCCKLIESILLSLPIPDLFMFRERTNDNEKYMLIDGLQRITCIKQFVSGVYCKDGKTKEFILRLKGSEWDGIKYSDLSEEDKEIFDDYSLKFNVFDSVENKEYIRKLYMQEIFERINTGSEKLTDQEIRNAIYSGNAIDEIKKISNKLEFKNLVKNTKKYSLNRCYDQELILRFLTYFSITKQLLKQSNLISELSDCTITSSKKKMLSDYLYCCNKGYIDFDSQIIELCNAIDYLNDFDENIFMGVSEKGINSRVNEVFAEAMVIYIMNGNKILVDKKQFDYNKIEFWNNTKLENNPFYSSTTNIKNILYRQEILNSIATSK